MKIRIYKPVKRIGWKYFRGKDIFGFELFEVELDNCNEEDYNWFLTINNLLD